MTNQLPYYTVEGKRYPRVTSILSILRDPDVEAWQARVGDKAAEAKRRHAERIGTTLDKLIKQELTGTTVTLPAKASSELQQGWKAWHEYKQLYPGVLSVGTPLISPSYGYGGEPDCFNERLIADIKATSRIREKHWIQLSAYVPLLFKPPEQWSSITLRVIRLDTFLGCCEVKERMFQMATLETFVKLKDVYCQWFNQEAPDVNAH